MNQPRVSFPLTAPVCSNQVRLEYLEEDVTDFLCRFDLNRKITFANRRLRAALEEPAPELLGKSFPLCIEAPDLPVVEDFLAAMLGPGKPGKGAQPVHFRVRFQSGETRFQKWLVRVISDHRGNPVEFQAVGRDYTWNVVSRSAARSLKQLQESNRELTHDLNNLLMVVSGAVESARKHSDNPEILQKRLDQVSTNLDRIRSLSHRLHCLNKETPGCDSFDPVGISRDVLTDLFSDEKVQVDFRSDEPAYRVRGDGREMERVFLNLFQNAREAMASAFPSSGKSLAPSRAPFQSGPPPHGGPPLKSRFRSPIGTDHG